MHDEKYINAVWVILTVSVFLVWLCASGTFPGIMAIAGPVTIFLTFIAFFGGWDVQTNIIRHLQIEDFVWNNRYVKFNLNES